MKNYRIWNITEDKNGVQQHLSFIVNFNSLGNSFEISAFVFYLVKSLHKTQTDYEQHVVGDNTKYSSWIKLRFQTQNFESEKKDEHFFKNEIVHRKNYYLTKEKL